MIKNFLSRLIQRELEPILSAITDLIAVSVRLEDQIKLLREERPPLIEEQTQGMLDPIPRTGKSWMRMKQELEQQDLRQAMRDASRP
jgi:hypothetical protein